jgi:hypothetical protein
MAATWRATAAAVTFASAKDMLDVFNSSGSAVIVRVYRAYQFNNTTTAITGVLTTMTIERTTAASVGTTVTPVAHDTNSTALPANVTAGHNRTISRTDVFRRYIWTNEEPVVAGTTLANWEVLVPFAEVWLSGYGDSNIEPIVCRAVQGFTIYHSGSTAVGSNDFEIEFTNT